MSHQKFKVIRDTREKEGQGWNFKVSDRCLGTEIRKLDSGDYSLEGMDTFFAIERKRSVSEIATNVNEKRFTDELDRLSTFKKSFIICEFLVDDIIQFPINSGIPRHKQHLVKVTGEYILRKLMEYQIKYPTHILFAGSHGQTLALSIFKRVVDEYKI